MVPPDGVVPHGGVSFTGRFSIGLYFSRPSLESDPKKRNQNLLHCSFYYCSKKEDEDENLWGYRCMGRWVYGAIGVWDDRCKGRWINAAID